MFDKSSLQTGVEKKSERSEKVQQAIREAMEKPNKKPDPPVTADDVQTETAGVASPPKPPRVYTYTEENKTEPQDELEGTGTEPRDEPQQPGNENETEEKIESTSPKKEDDASLQQNPFKLTFKKKESVPQAVVKPLPSTMSMFPVCDS
jgi:hypothetical protein